MIDKYQTDINIAAYEDKLNKINNYYKKIREQVKMDNVNKPAHYQGKVECIDAIESAVEGLEGLEAVCTANVIKYVWRWKKKNGIEDCYKAKWYLNKLIDEIMKQK